MQHADRKSTQNKRVFLNAASVDEYTGRPTHLQFPQHLIFGVILDRSLYKRLEKRRKFRGQVLTGGASRKGAQPCLVLFLPGSPALWVGSFNYDILIIEADKQN